MELVSFSLSRHHPIRVSMSSASSTVISVFPRAVSLLYCRSNILDALMVLLCEASRYSKIAETVVSDQPISMTNADRRPLATTDMVFDGSNVTVGHCKTLNRLEMASSRRGRGR